MRDYQGDAKIGLNEAKYICNFNKSNKKKQKQITQVYAGGVNY